MKRFWIASLIAIALTLAFLPSPVLADSCHHYQGQEVCLVQAQRSAKYHWQYRVKAIVDSQPQPLTRYNCRDHTRTVLEGAAKGTTAPFTPQDVGAWICQLVHRS